MTRGGSPFAAVYRVLPSYLNGVYTDTTKEAVRKFQEYAGLSTTDQTGIANAEVMKALLNTDAYTLLRSGDSKIREIQQALNNKYHSYIGLIPCDGLFTKKTMRALISGLQVEQKGHLQRRPESVPDLSNHEQL